jgi:hypothetical protein
MKNIPDGNQGSPTVLCFVMGIWWLVVGGWLLETGIMNML